MKRFKSITYFFLLFCASLSIVVGMEEDNQVLELTSKIEKLNVSDSQDPDQSAYFFKEDGTLYAKLFKANLELEKKNDLSSLITIIKNKDVTIDQKRTAFTCALKNFKMQFNIVHALIRVGMDLNYYFHYKNHKDPKAKKDVKPDEYYITPLIYAVKKMHLAFISIFIAAGADVDLASPYKDGKYSNMTPLIWAVRIGDLDKVNILAVTYCANLNIAQSRHSTDNAGITPLHLAVILRESKTIKMLLACKGIDVNYAQSEYAGDNAGITPLHSAVILEESKVIQMLLECEGIDVNYAQSKHAGKYAGATALHAACKNGNFSIIKMLIKAGAKNSMTLSFGSHSGMTPLFLAIKSRRVANVKLLLENGADINQSQQDTAGKNSGKTPLHYACSYEYFDFDILNLLLDAGAQVHVAQTKSAQCNAGMTALHWLAHSGKIKAINYLVDAYKTDINAALYAEAGEDAGITPLHLAVINNDIQTVSALLKYKEINVSAKQLQCAGVNAGYTPLHYACKKGFNTILEKLLNNDAVDLEMLEDLVNSANFYKNSGALNLIKNKKLHINMMTSKTQNTNNKRRKRKRKKRKKKKRNKPLNYNSRTSQEGAEDDEEEELEEAGQEISIDGNGRVCINFAKKEEIKVLEDSEAQHKFVFTGLKPFGGKVLTITVKKLRKIQSLLHKICQFGFDLSQRVCTGTRKQLKAPKKTQSIDTWQFDKATLKNPKMNNSNDPKHAFPLYVDENCCCWAVHYDEEGITEYDKKDLPRGKKLSDYQTKYVIYIPGIIELEKDGGFGVETTVGCFEYVILVPKGVVTSENRPLCVHRFFRPSK